MGEKIYNFAIIGVGVIGSMHAKWLQEIERAKLIAVCDINPAKAKEIGERYGCDYYSDLNDMLSRPDIDIVHVCTPSGMHSEHTIACARAGKHIISEKPIDTTVAKAEEMVAECRKAGVKLAVISQHRFQDSTVQVKQELDAGRFGTLIAGTGAINWYRSQEYYDSGEWRGTWELDGGGALMNQGVHTVDVLQYLMGPVESVTAYCKTAGHDRIEVEDIAVAILKFRNGAIGTLLGTTCAYPGLSARIEVFGKDGSAVIQSDKLVHQKFRDESNQENNEAVQAGTGAANPSAIDVGGHMFQIRDMIAAIEEDREPKMNGEDGLRPLRIILAVYESARTGREVTLPL
ncbi:Gfo/Idh/MocA family protein [Paenibacillus sp. N3.4]|uniref:Gfo/Idh/MocA family protein n=1 Tax=Paenibacillus sp. N3.4 TaxID=2603222 RepID=UPI0011C85997|nr:Gfo/Idh/MocA family oxidoreductase [Paenibacillus sp. N3.4]TXK84154.1 Gfo/Idh/MocA family oxidoreductase [Paenibacillus sp. N3.4]